MVGVDVVAGDDVVAGFAGAGVGASDAGSVERSANATSVGRFSWRCTGVIAHTA
ncbi:hypothetical protein JDM601_0022 [Mycolicibacter sinensis]|uniref:Uncharacterized protein n=1 Tax=Mycolicibacter sinensis (strain JDM601) TaxID=875328 RepID=F5YWC1_MYCSD|nr:hypothetical protein JDM601_0022 [Mycolicibacter sinensis]